MQSSIKLLMNRLIRLSNLMLAHAKEEDFGFSYLNNTFSKNEKYE